MLMDRRDLLKRMATLSTGAAWAGTLGAPRLTRAMPMLYGDGLPTPPALPDSVDRVIVIGAGFAGLTVANALANASVPHVVLEARDRIGGRLQTETIGGVPIDLGAAWIHDPFGNPVADFATQNGISFFEADPFNDALTGYDPALGAISAVDSGLALEVAEEFASPGVLAAKRALFPNGSVEQGLAHFLANDVPADYPSLSSEQINVIGFLARSALVEIAYAGASTDMSLEYFRRDSEFVGGDYLPSGGYTGLVEAMASGLNVRLGEEVTSVAYDAGGVSVTTTSGVETGSHVVVTVPLSVLDSGAITFTPGLPSSHTTAIANLGMGNLEKVVLQFPNAFWGGNRDSFYYVSATPGEYPLFLDWTTYVGQPTLVCLCAGEFARDLAALGDAAIEARVLAILAEIFGFTPPTPTAFHVTRWLSDPYALGSYSFIPVGGAPADMDTLGSPVGDRVLFAGEATDSAYYGTVHAAMLSGIREAKRMLQQSQVYLPEPTRWWPIAAGAAGLAWLAHRRSQPADLREPARSES